MQADPFQIGDVLKDAKRFVVPIYQRTYAWGRPHIEAFFDQLEAKAKERLNGTGEIFTHYMGAVLVIPRGRYAFGKLHVVDVVDGQQRLTTFQIFLAAIRDLAGQYGLTTAQDLLGSYLLNAEGPQVRERMERYKLYPTAYDRALFCDLVDLSAGELQKKYPEQFYKNGKVLESGELPLRAWGFFRSEAEAFVNEGGESERADRLTALSAALLEHFQVIVITLDEKDDAQVIFETLNVGGQPLAAMDLVRNDVFHRASRQPGEDVDLLMDRKWSAFEQPFWKEPRRRGRLVKPGIDFFLSDVLAAETGEEVLLSELYARYKKFVADRRFATIGEELDVLLQYTSIYRALFEPAQGGALARLARSLQVYDVTTAFPAVFVIETSAADEETKAGIYRLVESYVVRRILCGMPAKAYNNTFIRIGAQLKERGVTVENAVRAFAALDGDSVRFPSDIDLAKAILTRKQYGNIQQARLRCILGQFELAARDKFDEETTLPDDLTIEHVLPESWSAHWPLPDGAFAPQDMRSDMSPDQLRAIEDREHLKHTLGNLTLLNSARNPSIGNAGFADKRPHLSRSLLKLNQEIATHPAWDEAAIESRASRLTDFALTLWPGLHS